MTTKQRASIYELPGLCRRIQQARGLEHLVTLADGRVVYFDYDSRTRKVHVFEIVAELECQSLGHLQEIMSRTVARMDDESESVIVGTRRHSWVSFTRNEFCAVCGLESAGLWADERYNGVCPGPQHRPPPPARVPVVVKADDD